MAKKKTRVLLPGGIQGLVHDLQNGTSNFAPQPLVDPRELDSDENEGEKINEDRVGEHALKSSDNQVVNDDGGEVKPSPSIESATKKEDVDNDALVAESTPVGREAAPTLSDDDDANVRSRGRRPKENTMKEYHIVKDDSKDSWNLFVDMAQQYKNGGGKLATIYIDESLKSVLDRMKYAGPEKLSTSAILSSIVARFIYDHEDDIRKVLFSGNLI